MVFWGTRGSVPSPGPATARFGGNTPCLEVRTGEGGQLIFDAGTGIRALGSQAAAGEAPFRGELFLTHFHWDHIQGLPFFAPLYDGSTRLRVHAPRQEGVCPRSILAAQMSPVHFPVPLEAVSGRVQVETLGPEPWTGGGAEVEALGVPHSAAAVGYRVRVGAVSVAYVPDCELPDPGADGSGGYGRLRAFVEGADLLVHDAMYTDEEYAGRRGWGHSTFTRAVRLAEDAGVRRLRCFHHAPGRTDAELAGIGERLREGLLRRGSALEVEIAAEGEEITLSRGGTVPPPETTRRTP